MMTLAFDFLETYQVNYLESNYNQLFALENGNAIGYYAKQGEHYIQKLADGKIENIRIENKGFKNMPLPTDSLKLFRIKNSFALLHELKELHILDENFQATHEIKIDVPAGLFRDSGRLYSTFRSGPFTGVTDSNLVPLNLWGTTFPYFNWFVFLSVDIENKNAGLSASEIFSLNPLDFLDSSANFNDLPIINHLMIKNDRTYIFTTGTVVPKYTGQNYCALVEIGEKGALKEMLFTEMYAGINDQKKRGKSGLFTSSKEFCIISPLYKSKTTDSWNGMQRLFSMKENIFYDIKLPKGHASFKMIDHCNGFYWFQEYDEKNRIRTIVKAVVKNH